MERSGFLGGVIIVCSASFLFLILFVFVYSFLGGAGGCGVHVDVGFDRMREGVIIYRVWGVRCTNPTYR